MFVLQSSCRSASEMKVFLLTLICALVGAVAGGSVAWPGAVPVSFSAYSSAVLPSQTRSIAYSSSQYINALPSSPNFGYQPQFTYQLPQSSAFPSIAYQPLPSATYFPQSPFFYPQITQIAPVAPAVPATPAFPAIPAIPGIPASPALPAAPTPQQPAENPSNSPTQQPAGDEDSAVVDSAEFPQQQQQPDTQQTPMSDSSSQSDALSQSQISSQSEVSSASQFPSQTDFSSQPQFPSHLGFPSQYQPLFTPQAQPSLVGTQEAENMPPQSQQPAFPQFPNFPQFPQLPQLPQFPPFPSNPLFPQPTTPPPSSPAPDNDSKGLNDEDSISVDSA